MIQYGPGSWRRSGHGKKMHLLHVEANDVFDISQPIVDKTKGLVIHSRADATAAVVTWAENNTLAQLVHREIREYRIRALSHGISLK